jgi:NADH dehydrogenase
VVEFPFVKFKGPWLGTLDVPALMLILSVRNKLVIFFNWGWSYFTKDTSLAIITQINYKKEEIIDPKKKCNNSQN